MRSDKTDFHGKTNEDYKIDEPIFTYFVVNSVTTVGLFLNSLYKTRFPNAEIKEKIVEDDGLPF